MKRSLFGKTFTVAFWTAACRVLGLVRQILQARAFGTSVLQSAFVLAFQIPNLFRRLFGEGALSAAFVPVFTDSLRRRDRAAATVLASRLLTALALLLGSIAAAGILLLFLAQPLVPPASRWFHAIPLLRILLPYAPLICMAAATMGALQALDEFRAPAAAPCLLNLVWIATLALVLPRVGGAPERQIRVLSWAILFAGLLQFAFLAAVLRRRGFRIRPALGIVADPRIRAVCRIALPAAAAAAAFQVNAFLDNVIAMKAAPFAPSCLSYAVLIFDLPVGTVCTAFGTVLLATFSQQVSRGETDGLRQRLSESLSAILLLMLPAAAALAVIAMPVVTLFYQRGQFDALSTLRTARALSAYALGLPFIGIQKVAVQAFYARKDTRTPVRIAFSCIAANLSLNLLFVLTLPYEWRHVGIALSTTVSSALNALFLLRALRTDGLAPPPRALLRAVLVPLAASLAMAAALLAHRSWIYATVPTCGIPRLRPLPALLDLVSLGFAVYAFLVALLAPKALRSALRLRRRPSPPPPADNRG